MASMTRTMRRRIQRANGITTPLLRRGYRYPKPPTRTQRRHAKRAKRGNR